MKAFKQVGAEVPDSPFNPPKKVEQYIELHWADPAFWGWSNQKVTLKAGIALSEHRSLMHPEKAIPNLQQCEVLFCPAVSAAQAFYEAPLSCPIEIVPFGIDENMTFFPSRDWEDDVFKFLLIGAAQFRKGSWLAVEAFREAFGDRTDVQLTVASFSETPMFQRLRREYGRYENIKFYDKTSDVRDYYHTHHVLVSSHLAEGWGLTIPEAMATGMPCIISRCSAPREYFQDLFGWWIEMSDLYAPVDQCLTGVKGSWRLPNKDSIKAQMLYAVEHRDECEEKGKVASQFVLENLTWKQSAEKICQILERHL